jgi:two-component system LytT family sensor kinase
MDTSSLKPARSYNSDVLLLVVYWLLAAPIIYSSYRHDFGVQRALAGILYTILLDSVAVYLLVFKFLPMALSRRNALVLLASVVVFVVLDAHFYLLGYQLLFSERALHWTAQEVLNAIIQHTQSYGMLGILMAGKRYFEVQSRLLQTQKAQTESELRNLKAQIDPHFLFNNLNVLRGLIQQDPAEANEYLGRFANLYRFLIRHKEDDFVTVAEELQFVNEYIYLLRHRFGEAYAFRQELAETADLDRLLVVPGTLQLLVENAIKHNAGDEDDALLITIKVTETELVVRHALRPKLTPVDSTGLGLVNLRERYKLLYNKAIQVENTGTAFIVTVPVMRQAQVYSAA